ncbi:hypothetical protein Bbelb_213200 [Branchiostoma belcheri]|nr:hypothetical protein Bbelb_213200 [Branchiostoma belcheri]
MALSCPSCDGLSTTNPVHSWDVVTGRWRGRLSQTTDCVRDTLKNLRQNKIVGRDVCSDQDTRRLHPHNRFYRPELQRETLKRPRVETLKTHSTGRPFLIEHAELPVLFRTPISKSEPKEPPLPEWWFSRQKAASDLLESTHAHKEAD